jgi:hypothetical protein
MKVAASVSYRAKIRHRKIAQKIIISHIKNYLGSVLWAVNLIDDDRYPSVQLPNYKDYEYVLSDLNEGGLSFVSEKSNRGLILVAVPNAYIKRTDDGKLKWEHRLEDEGKKDIPKIAYLVINEELLSEKNDKRFKCRDMKKFLEKVRAVFAPDLIKKFLENMAKMEYKDAKSYTEHLKGSGANKKTITTYSYLNNNQVKIGRPAKITPKSIIRRDFFQDNRKKMDDAIRELRKIGISLTPL